jgi:VanZ family protein
VRALRYGRFWLSAGLLFAATVLVLSLLPLPPVVQQASDKLLHVLAYLGLSLWFGAVYEPRRHSAVIVSLLAFGILIECLQGLTAYRSTELMDVLADAAGTAIGIVLANTTIGQGLVWFERRVVRA